MPDMTYHVAANTMLRGQTHLLELLNNILAAIEEWSRTYTKNRITEIFNEVAMRQTPWNEQLVKIQTKIQNDDQLDDRTKQKANEVIMAYYNKNLKKHREPEAKKGFDELRRLFNKSGLPKVDKKIVGKIIDESMYERKDPHHITVNRGSYRHVMRLLNDMNMSSQVTALQTVSNEYLLLYNASIESQMRQCVELAALYQGILPRPDLDDLEAFAAADRDNPGNIIKFEGLSPELAEKAIMESTKTHTFSFAKSEEKEDGTVDLYCYAGSTPEEKRSYYQQAVQTLALAAYSLTGPTGDIEKRRAAFSAREQEKINTVLNAIRNNEVDTEDRGYVFNIAHLDTEKNGQHDRYILADDFIQFGPEEFTAYYNQNRYMVSADNCQDYTNTLKLNIQSGPGQKVYISDKEMDQIMESTKKAYAYYQEMPKQNRMDQIIQIEKEIEDTRQKIKNAPSEAARLGYLDQLKVQRIVGDALHLHVREEITPEKLKSRAIGLRLAEAEFKEYASPDITKEMVDNAQTCNSALRRNLKDSEVLENLDPDIANIADVRDVLEHATYTNYVNDLMQQQPGQIPIEQVQKICDVLDNSFDSRKKAAAELLDNIQVKILEPRLDPQAQVMKNTQKLRARVQNAYNKLMNVMQDNELGSQELRESLLEAGDMRSDDHRYEDHSNSTSRADDYGYDTSYEQDLPFDDFSFKGEDTSHHSDLSFTQ